MSAPVAAAAHMQASPRLPLKHLFLTAIHRAGICHCIGGMLLCTESLSIRNIACETDMHKKQQHALRALPCTTFIASHGPHTQAPHLSLHSLPLSDAPFFLAQLAT